MRDTWQLDDSIHFLNRGSFRATARVVLEQQRELQRRLEAEPVRFMKRELEPLLERARARLADFVGAQGEDLAFVTNPTTGVNAVLRSLAFQPGDELVATRARTRCASWLSAPARRWWWRRCPSTSRARAPSKRRCSPR